MQTPTFLNKQGRLVFIILLIYFCCAAILFPYISYYTDSPDTVFYLTISKKYASGNFTGAINNYWSPLISWLLVPFHWAGTDPMVSFKLMQVLIGACALILSARLSHFFIPGNALKLLFLFSLFPFFLSAAFLYQTPDLLFLTLVLGVLYLLFKFMYMIRNPQESWRFPIWQTGLTGGLLFLSKAYGFPFFVAMLTCYTFYEMIRWKEQQIRKRILRASILSLAVFSMVVGFWVGCLYTKYGTISTGYASVYNFNLLAPGRFDPGKSNLQHPVLAQGLMDVSSHEEASAWESPGTSKLPTWSPFESKAYFSHYLKIIQYNWISLYYFIIRRNVGMVFLLTLLLFVLVKKRTSFSDSTPLLLSLVFLFVYTAGYSFIFIMPRYLWFSQWLMLILIFHMWDKQKRDAPRRSYAAYFAIAITFVWMTKKPVKEIFFGQDADMTAIQIGSALTNPIQTLEKSYSSSDQLPALIAQLKELRIEHQNVAGLRSNDPNHFSYTQSLVLCMYLNQSFFGELPVDINAIEMHGQLKSHEIKYLYCWVPNPGTFKGLNRVLEDPHSGFTVFEVLR